MALTPSVCTQLCALALNIILAELVVSDIRILDRHCVGLHTPPDVTASQTGSDRKFARSGM